MIQPNSPPCHRAGSLASSSVARRELVDLVPADQERRSEETSSLKYSVVLFLFWNRCLKTDVLKSREALSYSPS